MKKSIICTFGEMIFDELAKGRVTRRLVHDDDTPKKMIQTRSFNPIINVIIFSRVRKKKRRMKNEDRERKS